MRRVNVGSIIIIFMWFSSLLVLPISGDREHTDLDLYLKFATFDPLKEKPNLPSHLIYSKDSGYYIVQLKGPIQPHWIEKLISFGADIVGYIPDFAYIVHMDKNVKNLIEKISFIRWIGRYQPAYKIDTSLFGRQGEIDLNIVVFRGENRYRNLKDTIEKIKSLEGEILYEGEDNFIIQTRIDAARIPDIAFIPHVEWLHEHTPPVPSMDNIRVFTGASSPLHIKGFNGTGVVGEVKDTGLDPDHPEFQGQLLGTDGNVADDYHGTCTFGIVWAKGLNDRAMGMIPGSKGVFANWGVGRKESIANLVNNWGGLFQSNSWMVGNCNSTYSSYSQENDEAVFEYDVSMLYCAGNYGYNWTISQEATAKNVIAVGGISHYDNQDRTDDAHEEGGASKGPAEDGRIKPDVSGPYDCIYTTLPVSEGSYYDSFMGTSGATPVAAGCVGLIYEMYKRNHFGNNPSGDTPNAATVKAILIADAYQYELSKADRFAQGWGGVDIGNIYKIGKNHFIDDEEINLQTGEFSTYTVEATDLYPLKISLVWTDVPGTTSASKHLINDLNLKVIDPNGVEYHGNHDLVNSTWSSSGGSPDDINNIENVFIEVPIPGEWTIEVSAFNIAQDGNPDTGQIDQSYALVASGVNIAENDIAIFDLDVPDNVEPYIPNYMDTTVVNVGNNHENDVTVNLLIDGVIIDSHIITTLNRGTSHPVNFSWTPLYETKSCNLTVETTLVPNESRTYNNFISVYVDVSRTRGWILVDAAHGNMNHWDFYHHLTSQNYKINCNTLRFTSEILEGYDSLIITPPRYSSFSSDEISALRAYVENGTGLFVIGDNHDDGYMYAGYFNPLTDYTGITWENVPAVGGTITDINTHEITEDVTSMYLPTPRIQLQVEPPAQEIAYDNHMTSDHILIAASEYMQGRVVALAEVNCLDKGNLSKEDNLQFGENVIEWITNEAPIATIDSPIEGTIFKEGSQINFDASTSYDPEGDGLTYKWSSSIDGALATTCTFSTSLSLGEHIIYLEVMDEKGKKGYFAIPIRVGPPPPIVTIDSPSDGEVLGGLITILVNVTSQGGVIEKVELCFNSVSWFTISGTTNFSYIWDTTRLSDGINFIEARAIDNYGSISQIVNISVTVDNTPPVILSGPQVKSITDSSALIEWETDESSDSIVEYWPIDGSKRIYNDTNYVIIHRITLTVLKDNEFYKFRVKSTDPVGNGPTESATNNFKTEQKPDFDPPNISIQYPGNNDIVEGFVQVTVEVYDAISGVYEVRYYIDDDLKYTNSQPDYSWDLNTFSYRDGEYTLRAVATDNAGNEASHEITILIDNVFIEPAIKSTSVNVESVYEDEMTLLLFTVTISDPEDNLVLVTIDLSEIGGSQSEMMYDDGTHGDAISQDGIYSCDFLYSGTNSGERALRITLEDRNGATYSEYLYLTVKDSGSGEEGLLGSLTSTNSWIWFIVIIICSMVIVIAAVVKASSGKKKRMVPEGGPQVIEVTTLTSAEDIPSIVTVTPIEYSDGIYREQQTR